MRHPLARVDQIQASPCADCVAGPYSKHRSGCPAKSQQNRSYDLGLPVTCVRNMKVRQRLGFASQEEGETLIIR